MTRFRRGGFHSTILKSLDPSLCYLFFSDILVRYYFSTVHAQIWNLQLKTWYHLSFPLIHLLISIPFFLSIPSRSLFSQTTRTPKPLMIRFFYVDGRRTLVKRENCPMSVHKSSLHLPREVVFISQVDQALEAQTPSSTSKCVKEVRRLLSERVAIWFSSLAISHLVSASF